MTAPLARLFHGIDHGHWLSYHLSLSLAIGGPWGRSREINNAQFDYFLYKWTIVCSGSVPFCFGSISRVDRIDIRTPVLCLVAGNCFKLNSNPRLGGKHFQVKFEPSSWRETFSVTSINYQQTEHKKRMHHDNAAA